MKHTTVKQSTWNSPYVFARNKLWCSASNLTSSVSTNETLSNVIYDSVYNPIYISIINFLNKLVDINHNKRK